MKGTEMENHTHMLNHKLNPFTMLKEALMIPFKSTNMIVLCFPASVPLFFSLIFHEMMLRRALVVVSNVLREPEAEIHGADALELSVYLCRGSERRGFLLMLMFFVSGIGLRHYDSRVSTAEAVRKGGEWL
ncbi:hypothetical protein V6N11_007417 [Hibiscus sabdariffa]|uniref:Uncharacterized protein n=1 Tax=Hibiscus sabdariffa TaxID=183260 RepID=A0ABR2NS21_9ROSI